jgi:hypothetical protein
VTVKDLQTRTQTVVERAGVATWLRISG